MPLNNSPECIQCGACIAQCPRKIPVRDIVAAVEDYQKDQNLITAQRKYDAVTNWANCASRCVECGSCQGHCKPRVKIFSYLREAVNIFGR